MKERRRSSQTLVVISQVSLSVRAEAPYLRVCGVREALSIVRIARGRSVSRRDGICDIQLESLD